MTEKQFWEHLDKGLKKAVDGGQHTHEQFVKRINKLMLDAVEDLRGAKGKARVKLIEKLFRQAGYNKYWLDVKLNFDRLLKLQNEHWKKNITGNRHVSRSNTSLMAYEKVHFNNFGDLGQEGVRNVEGVFKDAVKKDWSLAKLTQELTPIGGRVGAYAQTIADTALRGWDRTVTAMKAEQAGIKKAKYAGPPIIPTSHKFCKDHINQVYTYDQIMQMNNRQLNPVITYCGGYRCRHRWEWRIDRVLKK